MMNDAEIRTALEAERLSLSGFLDGLDDAEWSRPSLCTGWTVRDVVAHLTIPTRTTTLAMFSGMFKARGDFHRMTYRSARVRAAAFRPDELVRQLRDTAGSPRRMPGSAPMDPLVDVLVHGQDIARPLGRERAMPIEAAAAALAYVATNSFYGAPARFAGLALITTDTGATLGAGSQEVRGMTEDLLLVATGRAAGLVHLVGAGVDRLAGRFTGT